MPAGSASPPPEPGSADADDRREGAPSSSIRLGPALRRAWVGYQQRLDEAMADAGFGPRRFPDGRVLRLCTGAGSTISAVGRDLDITRQGASKLVARLRDAGYVLIADSPTSGREKAVIVTPRGADYLNAQRVAARAIEAEVRATVGEQGLASLVALLAFFDGDGRDEEKRMRSYLQRSAPRPGEAGP